MMKWLCQLSHLLLLSYLLYSKLHCSMRGAVAYLMGLAGPSGFGSRSTAEQVTDNVSVPPHLTVIITGATSGIGVETARVLAKRGARLVLPARDVKKGCEVREKILKESARGAEIIVMEMDLSSFDSICNFCSRFLSLGLPLNILINNAGKYSKRLELTEEKFEKTFATNYLGHYLLTEILLERMVQTASLTGIEGRIINVSSVIHVWVKRETFRFDDMLNPKDYNGTHAYAQSKLANILHAKEMARQLRERKAKVTVNAIHPGVVNTGIIRDHKGFFTNLVLFLASRLLKSIPQGASTTCYVALSPQMAGISGQYYTNCNASSCSSLAGDAIEGRKLWRETHELVYKKLVGHSSAMVLPLIQNSERIKMYTTLSLICEEVVFATPDTNNKSYRDAKQCPL